MRLRLSLMAVLTLFVASFVPIGVRAARAATAAATIHAISATGVGARLGVVTFADSAGGLVITPKLSGLPPGEHGFHIHEKADCGPGMNQGKPAAGFAAGGHYDPAHTKKHLGPQHAGHRGDLSVLWWIGDTTQAVTAPHLTVSQIRGRSIMIHAGGDNYSDTPAPLGWRGAHRLWRDQVIAMARDALHGRRLGIVPAIAFGLAAVATASGAAGGPAANPFELAVKHAGLAAKATEITTIREHLQHALNCLEGSGGQDFKAMPANPCTGQGAVDTLSKGSADLIRARKSIALARVGVTLHDREPAHYVAEAIHAILTEGQR